MTPDPSKFPQPNSWATYTLARGPNFKSHKTLGMAKAAITNTANAYSRQQALTQDWWIYRYIDGEWVEYLHLPAGSGRNHELWTDPKHGPKVKPVSEQAVNKAIASILKVVP